jgi:hypothetical protein
MSGVPETRQVRIAICGFGARGRLAYICRVAQDLTDLWLGKPLDQTRRIHDYYDMQSQENGPGVAFQLQSNAALNTDVPGPVNIDTKGLTAEKATIVNNLTDLAAHYEDLTMEDRDQTLADFEKENISTAILFSLASRDGILNTSTACGSRSPVGHALVKMTEEAKELQEEYLPWLQTKFYLDARVIDVNISNPRKPILTILKNGQETILEAYDLLVKTTGTTWKVPVPAVVAEKAFIGVPNSENLWRYLEQRQKINDEGLIKPGTRILVGGASLSALDWVGIILAKTGIVKVDESNASGYTIDSFRARLYPNLITFFSRRQGKFVPSRHANQGSLPDESIIFSPEMILSHQLQKGQDPYPVYLDMARLITAVGLKKFPNEIEPVLTKTLQLRQMSEDNQSHAADSTARTEPYMMRAALTSLLFSCTLGRNSAEIQTGRSNLIQQHDLLVRNPFDASRSMIFNATHPIEGSPEDSREGNEKHTKALNEVFAHVASAPFPIHHLVTQLFDLGVVSWVEGDYNIVSWSEEREKFVLNPDLVQMRELKDAHCLIASRILTSETDLLSERLLAQTKTTAPEEPVYDKGRFPKARSGERIHVIELGILGHGQRSVDPRTVNRTVNSQWFDTNSYITAAHVMPTIATTISMLEKMFLRNIAVPVDDLMALHHRTLPSPSNFAKQAEKLRRPFEECHEILAFARLAEEMCSDGIDFADKMAVAMDKDAREAMAADMRRELGNTGHSPMVLFTARRVFDKYAQALGKITFQPHDLNSFETTTPDFSSIQIADMKRIQAEEYGRLDEPTEPTEPAQPDGPVVPVVPKSWSNWVLWLFWLLIYYLFALALTAAYCHVETLTASSGHLASYALARMLLWLVFSGWLFLGLSWAAVTVPKVAKAVLLKSAELLLF